MKTGLIVLAALLVSSSAWADRSFKKGEVDLSFGGYGASNGETGLGFQGKAWFQRDGKPVAQSYKKIPRGSKFSTVDRAPFPGNFPLPYMMIEGGGDLPVAGMNQKGQRNFLLNIALFGLTEQARDWNASMQFLPFGIRLKSDDRLRSGAVGLNAAAMGIDLEGFINEKLAACLSARMFDLTAGGRAWIQDAKGPLLIEPLSLEACLKVKLGEEAGSVRLGFKVSEALLGNDWKHQAPAVSSAAVSLSYQKKFQDFSVGAGLESSIARSISAASANPLTTVEDTVKINRATVDLVF